MTITIIDYSDKLNVLERKLNVLARELTALVDPRLCLPVIEKRHLVHVHQFTEACGMDPTDACIMSIVVEDPVSDYFVTSDRVKIMTLMTKNFQYTKEEVTATVKKFGADGAYVSVPSSWIGGHVKVMLLNTNTVNINWEEEGIKKKQ